MEYNLFYKYVCDYVLKNLTTYQLIEAALECITAGIECENLYILAGLSKNDNIIHYYRLTLDELNIQEPNEKDAGIYLIKYYCNELIQDKISPNVLLHKIKYEVYEKTGKDNKVVGDYLKIEEFISLFYEIDDIKQLDNYNKNIEEKVYSICHKLAEEYIKKCI